MNGISRKKDKLIFFVLSLYCFIAVFGQLFKFYKVESSIGLSTILLLIIIIPKTFIIFDTILKQPVFLSILVLLLWGSIGSLFSEYGILKSYIRLVLLFGYLFAAVSVCRIQLTEDRIRILVNTLSLSMLIASLLTIIDYLKIYNIPYANEHYELTRMGGERIEQAGGFFVRRTAMASFYSLIVPALMYYAFKVKNIKGKVFMLCSSFTGFVALLLTHNRSGVLSIILALLLYLLIDRSIKIGSKIVTLAYISILFGILLYALYLFFPVHLDVYMMKLYSYLPFEGIEASNRVDRNIIVSDSSRIYFFITVMDSLLSNPIGNGFGSIYTEKYGFVSPHNIITHLIWASGVLAFIWLPIFSFQIYKSFSLKYIYIKNNIYMAGITALQVGLLSWFLNNMAHNSLNTGLAWIFLGLILNIRKKLILEKNNKFKNPQKIG